MLTGSRVSEFEPSCKRNVVTCCFREPSKKQSVVGLFVWEGRRDEIQEVRPLESPR